MQHSIPNISLALVKPLLAPLFLLALIGCGIPGIQKSAVKIDMSSSTEIKDGQITHGCLVKASKGRRQFEQTIRYEHTEAGFKIQYSTADISIDPDTGQINLGIYCQAENPYMLENTTVESNVFKNMALSARLDTEKRFESNLDRDQYLKELIRTGFTISASAWNSSYLDVAQIPTNNPLFQAGEVDGFFTAPYSLLGIWRQSSPNCSYGVFTPREFTITIPPQKPEDVGSYRYIDPTLRSIQKDAIYIPDWYASGVIVGYMC